MDVDGDNDPLVDRKGKGKDGDDNDLPSIRRAKGKGRERERGRGRARADVESTRMVRITGITRTTGLARHIAVNE